MFKSLKSARAEWIKKGKSVKMNKKTIPLIGYAFAIIGIIMLVAGYFETVYVFASGFVLLIIGILLLLVLHALENRAENIRRDEERLEQRKAQNK